MTIRPLTRIYTPQMERHVYVRPDTSDSQVWADTFTGLYHLPPPEMPDPETVLDLGANIGLTAAHYRHLWPNADILAVEMDEGNHRLAEWNAPDVRHEHAAVAATFGPGHYDPRAESFAFALSELPEIPGFEFVSCFSIADFAARFESGEIDFVKMDVEGEEWVLFETLADWAPLVNHLLVELHGGDSDEMLDAAIETLEAEGFHARHHPPHPQAVYAW